MPAITFTAQQIDFLFEALRKPDLQEFDRFIQFLLQINAGTDGVQNITFAAITALIGGNTLVPGQLYRITDFNSEIDVPNAGITISGPITPLIVKATGTATLADFAYDTSQPLDVLTYDVSDVLFGATTGRITNRVALDIQVSAPFDFRIAQFRRWETAPASGIFTIITDNGNAFQDSFAFELSAGANQAINCSTDKFQLPGGVEQQSNIIISSGASNVHFASGCLDSTLLAGCLNISVGEQCGNITILSNTLNVVIGGTSNTIAIGTGCTNITIGQNSQFIDIGDFSSQVTLGARCTFSSLGDGSTNITIGNGCNSNTIPDFCSQIYIEDGCSTNGFGGTNTSIRLQGGSSLNDFGDNCTEINLGFDCDGNLFGVSCSNITIGAGGSSNTFADDCVQVELTDGVSSQGIIAGTTYRRETLTDGEQYYTYDFGVLGGATGQFTLSNIPIDSTIIYALIDPTTLPTSGTSTAELTFGVETNGATELLGATLVTNAIFQSGVWMNLEQRFLDPAFTTKTTAIRNLIMNILVEALTAGVFNFHVKYVKEF